MGLTPFAKQTEHSAILNGFYRHGVVAEWEPKLEWQQTGEPLVSAFLSTVTESRTTVEKEL